MLIPLMIGTTEILLLAGVALLIFGGKKLPQMMRNMGKGVKEFKEGVQGAPDSFKEGMNEDEQPRPDNNPEDSESSSEQKGNQSIDEQ